MSKTLEIHNKLKGKISIESKVKLDEKMLNLVYTPGVAEVSKHIAKHPDDMYKYTPKGNMVAIVTDGSAVLGLGDIGPKAAYPVMEGKSVLFKEFGGVDAFPICLDTKDVDEIINTVKLISPGFGGINLEDISAPRCFEIERRLIEELDIPIFHDDQHGTAIVVLAGLINSLKLTNKKINEIKIVFSGAGAAGIACAKLLIKYGVKNFIMVDTAGAIYDGRNENMNQYKIEIAKLTNPDKIQGSLSDVIIGADVFIGVSGPNLLTNENIKTMAKDPIIFALANPEPEIRPEDATDAFIMATGRSDYPNQINNVLAFPGVFRGALDICAKKITDEMKIAAAEAIANYIQPTKEKIIPGVFDGVNSLVAEAVKKAYK